MDFSVLMPGSWPPSTARDEAFLVSDNWNDFSYRTLFHLQVADHMGRIVPMGMVKIGSKTAGPAPYNIVSEGLPQHFSALDERFFSLGQDREYYDALNTLAPALRRSILVSLRDIAFNEHLYQEVRGLNVTNISLMRSVPELTVVEQFRRIARGGDRLVSFWFNYSRPSQGLNLEFKVKPESTPPTNIHVLIGQNGAGKTRIMRGMTQAFRERNALSPLRRLESESGSFHTEAEQSDVFANMVTVSFSAFDPLDPLQVQTASDEQDCISVGLFTSEGEPSGGFRPKTPSELNDEFVSSFLFCAQEPTRSRWLRAVGVLKSDPNFYDSGIAEIFDQDGFGVTDVRPQGAEALDLSRKVETIYRQLSSGHRAVLLTITKLMETVQERTLVLLDEPESHLHPPLLSAFVRALSDLLVERNGVAIIATHSPVVLQEVPSNCVWKIWRAGSRTQHERPAIETFGEEVGLLTHEVFGLEVTRSGFHALIATYVDRGMGYREIVRAFDGQLGQEARAIIQGLVAARETE